MVSWKGLAFITALVAQATAYQGNSLYGRDYHSVYARDAEAEAYDDDSWDFNAREAGPEADHDDDFDLSYLGRREAVVDGANRHTGTRNRQPGAKARLLLNTMVAD